jgi:hypothetical protein
MSTSSKKMTVSEFIQENTTLIAVAIAVFLLACAAIPELRSFILGLSTVILVLGFIGVLFAMYMIPTIIAYIRKHPNVAPIAVINVLLGWTVVGFAVALAWAFMAIEKRE